MSLRMQRLNHLFSIELSKLLQKEYRSSCYGLVSVIDSVISPDLKHAKVYLSILGKNSDQSKSLEKLNKNSWSISGQLGKLLHIKYSPKIIFFLDHSLEKGSNILNKINKLEKEIKKPST